MSHPGEPRMPDFAEGRRRSVDNLQQLYAVVVSLAVAALLQRVLAGPSGASIPDLSKVSIAQWLMLISFLITVVPFYHGANRYLDVTYITGERFPRRPALLIDFVFLFLEGVLFFVLAEFVGDQQAFYSTLAIVLFLDAVWVVSSSNFWSLPLPGSREDVSATSYWPWAVMNVAAVILIWIFARSNLWPNNLVQSISLVVIVVVRTVLDYIFVFDFYYPPEYSGTSHK